MKQMTQTMCYLFFEFTEIYRVGIRLEETIVNVELIATSIDLLFSHISFLINSSYLHKNRSANKGAQLVFLGIFKDRWKFLRKTTMMLLNRNSSIYFYYLLQCTIRIVFNRIVFKMIHDNIILKYITSRNMEKTDLVVKFFIRIFTLVVFKCLN